MIRVDRLHKRFGAVQAVRDLSFEVPPGEILGFLGPNGAGKTTTLRILSGFLPPSSGAAAVAGHDLTQASIQARRATGYLPESFVAPPELRVGEYLRFRAGLKAVPGARRRRRVAEVTEMLGLGPRLRQPFSALSKGFRQRVGLADALLADPPALLLDEPFGGLDPLQRQEFRELLRGLAHDHRKAVLFSSHVLPEVEELADRVLVIDEGRALALGSREELLSRLDQAPRQRLRISGDGAALGRKLPEAFPGLEVLACDGGELLLQLADAGQRGALFRWFACRGEEVLAFHPDTPTLEDLFRVLVAGAPGAPEEAA
ncbi:MAG: ABC transporter ATP-binding protein [Planctomycetes bacterium]|nr:ABC transporter ATP-binding protein [Planctomycetota bacterium]MBL7007844.1 ABC transporter ATP-binding protein [Planctomycetota bacterium]